MQFAAHSFFVISFFSAQHAFKLSLLTQVALSLVHTLVLSFLAQHTFSPLHSFFSAQQGFVQSLSQAFSTVSILTSSFLTSLQDVKPNAKITANTNTTFFIINFY